MTTPRTVCDSLILLAMSWTTALGEAVQDQPFPQVPPSGPAYVGPGHHGTPVSPDENGRIVVAGGEFDALNVTMLSWLTLTELDPAGDGVNDCWGYVSPGGVEYAIVGTESSTSFVRLSDPLNPVVVGQVSDAFSTWSDIKVYGEYAYNVNETSANGIQVISLVDIDSDVIGPVSEVHANGINEAHNIVINTDSGFAYAVGWNNSGGLAAYDLGADPVNPPYVGGWSDQYVHDAQVVNYTSGPWAGKEIAFCFCTGAGLFIVDVTDKGAMATISSTGYPLLAICHQGWTEDKQYLYVNDEGDETNAGITTRTLIFDISDLNAPTLVNTVTTGLDSIDHNLYVRESVIYESNYTSGLQVYLAEDPEAPVLSGFFDSHPEDNATHFDGTWSNYPFLPSGIVLLSDRTRGLFVLDVDVQLPGIDIPTVSQWGLVILTLLLLTAGTLVAARRRSVAA